MTRRPSISRPRRTLIALGPAVVFILLATGNILLWRQATRVTNDLAMSLSTDMANQTAWRITSLLEERRGDLLHLATVIQHTDARERRERFAIDARGIIGRHPEYGWIGYTDLNGTYLDVISSTGTSYEPPATDFAVSLPPTSMQVNVHTDALWVHLSVSWSDQIADSAAPPAGTVQAVFRMDALLHTVERLATTHDVALAVMVDSVPLIGPTDGVPAVTAERFSFAGASWEVYAVPAPAGRFARLRRETDRWLAAGLVGAFLAGAFLEVIRRRGARLAAHARDLADLAAEREQLSQILHNSPAIAFIWRNTEGWPIEFVSANVRTLGYAPEDLYAGRITFANMVHPDDLGRVTEEVRRFSEAGRESFSQEYRLLTASGEARWVDDHTWVQRLADDTITHYQGIIIDVTERHRAEQALAETERRLHFAIEQVPIPVIIASAPDVAITHFNQAAVDLLTKPAGDLKNIALAEHREYWPTFFPDGRPYPIEDLPLTRAVKRGETTRDAEVIVRRSDGEHWLSASAAPLLDNEGRIVAGIVVFPEITQRKQTEQELIRYRQHLEDLVAERTRQLEAAQEELLRQERLAALGQLIGTVSHEIRNPLGTIRSSVYTIARAVRDHNLGLERALERTERSIQRCDRIIEELLDYARVPKLRVESVHLDTWLNEVLNEEPPPGNIQLERELHADITLRIDRERLRRCLLNLLNNAFQAIQEANRNDGRVSVQAALQSTDAVVTIRDNGIGISADALSKVFEPLYSTKSFGVGLGLSIVRQVVEQHGGRIEIESVEQQGTTVTVRLPLNHDGALRGQERDNSCS